MFFCLSYDPSLCDNDATPFDPYILQIINSCTGFRCWRAVYFLFDFDGYALPLMFENLEISNAIVWNEGGGLSGH